MNMFESKEELLSILDYHDQLIQDCLKGSISFQAFLEKYDSFYMSYALDGHESDFEEKMLLDNCENRISPHREIWDSIIGGGLASDSNPYKEEHIKAGRRFGNSEALKRLETTASKYFPASNKLFENSK